MSEQDEAAQFSAVLTAINAGTLLIVRPGDKVIVRVMGEPSRAEIARLRQLCNEFLGEENCLIIGEGVEFTLLRQGEVLG